MFRTLEACELKRDPRAIAYSFQNIPSGYLRISITDVCNMNCTYCHNEGQVGIKSHFMTVDQLRFIVTNGLRFGLVKVRLTGGEPLLHPQCHEMLRVLKREIRIPTVGFNTNGIRIDSLLPIVSEKLLDDVVVGLDYNDGAVSKDSDVGLHSEAILEHILALTSLGQNVSIACVYDGDYDRLERLAAWCLSNHVPLKVLEKTGTKVESDICPVFASMAQRIVKRFSLDVGFLATSRAYYGIANSVPSIYFLRSHCRLRECVLCSKIHVRVTSDGFAKSCIQEDLKYPLLTGSFDDSMLKVLANLGFPPETRQTKAGV
jgi:cyclic pyranopterin phosphate synthase